MAGAHVLTMSFMSKYEPAFDSTLAWTLAGPFFASPLELLLYLVIDVPGHVPWGVLSGLILGLLGGLAAGLHRPRIVH